MRGCCFGCGLRSNWNHYELTRNLRRKKCSLLLCAKLSSFGSCLWYQTTYSCLQHCFQWRFSTKLLNFGDERYCWIAFCMIYLNLCKRLFFYTGFFISSLEKQAYRLYRIDPKWMVGQYLEILKIMKNSGSQKFEQFWQIEKPNFLPWNTLHQILQNKCISSYLRVITSSQ